MFAYFLYHNQIIDENMKIRVQISLKVLWLKHVWRHKTSTYILFDFFQSISEELDTRDICIIVYIRRVFVLNFAFSYICSSTIYMKRHPKKLKVEGNLKLLLFYPIIIWKILSHIYKALNLNRNYSLSKWHTFILCA